MSSLGLSPAQITANRRQKLFVASSYLVQMAGAAAQLYASEHYWHQPYRTSKLTRQEWVQEVLDGHPERIRSELGVSLHVFSLLVHELRVFYGVGDSRKGIDVEE
ncbi:hypothetical protein BKA70DRAFT_1116551 [Coprinopsis sp. MPI-PUGE-AT-0042]|nr:hypothetical protein BKA70DRAFT_1116551 [Coprinopsis sp. MPI-PUGE-AT-0042]